MIIQKVINNNVVSTFDANGKEVILMGKGIGFRKKAGDELDKNKIEKIFTLDLSGKSSFVQEVMAIIQEFYEIVLNPEHPAYQRFATHLQYLETEIMSKKHPMEEDEEADVSKNLFWDICFYINSIFSIFFFQKLSMSSDLLNLTCILIII